MKLGVHMYVTGYTIDPVTIARAVEDAALESFWVPEHAIMPADPAIKFWDGGDVPRLYGEMADPLVLLSFIGGATTTLKLGTGVCIIPERHPLLQAKMISTLDNFSKGRLLLGIGVGWMREEIELFGIDFDTRWRFATEAVEAMKALWATGQASYDGTLVKFPEVICDPLPAQRPHPPIILGVLPSEASWRRIATWGDGWLTMGSTAEEVRAGRMAIDRACDEVGRDPAEIEITAASWELDPVTRDAYEGAGADRLLAMLYNHPGRRVEQDQATETLLTAARTAPPTASQTLAALDGILARARL